MNLKPLGANKTEVTIGDVTVFFSYRTPVASIENGAYYRTAKFWSRTTSKHINQWVGGMPMTGTKPQEHFDNLLSEVK